jgi:hypothetical protein
MCASVVLELSATLARAPYSIRGRGRHLRTAPPPGVALVAHPDRLLSQAQRRSRSCATAHAGNQGRGDVSGSSAETPGAASAGSSEPSGSSATPSVPDSHDADIRNLVIDSVHPGGYDANMSACARR